MEQDKKFYTLIVFSENFAGVLNQAYKRAKKGK